MDVQSVPPKDATPSTAKPPFGRARFGDPDDETVVVDGDPPRADPVRVLGRHEVANDAAGLLADGTARDPTTGASDDGGRLGRPPAGTMFAFARQDVHGSGAFHEP